MAGLFSFLSGGANTRAFHRIEDGLTKDFTEVDNIKNKYQGLQNKREKVQDESNNFNEANSHLPENNLTSEHNNKNLVWRKCATVSIDAIVSLAAIKLFFMETVNIDVPLLPSIILGICVAYLLLKLSISYRHYDSERVIINTFAGLWMRYSYIIPLLIIPVLSLYLVVFNPGNPANYIWVSFLVFSFLLNLKAASYSTQYVEMEQMKSRDKTQQRYQKRLDEIDKKITNLQTRVQRIANGITIKATKFRREYERFNDENRPPVSLLEKYIFVLNTRIYNTIVIKHGELSINLPPPGPISEFNTWWDEATNSPQIYANTNTVGQANETIGLPGEPVENVQQNDFANPQQTPPNEPEPNDFTEDESFGKTVSDNEKFV